ncbi:ArsR family transcriptional regulator [Hyphomicrobiales bacterium]|nr:ArsR family transcriptional regulator [Hyphomicrobiales bacterium]CAH1692605.1 ArsR family transcriptional regulator [Hyphomicrobiales bacterium]
MDQSLTASTRGRRRNGDGAASRAEGQQGQGFLVVDAGRQYQVLRGLASPVRLRILKLLNRHGPKNINQIAEALDLPQSTIATNIQVLEEAELISTSLGKAAKGQQKICAARYSEIVVNLDPEDPSRENNIVEVEMPLGLYTSSNVSAPCGLCSTQRILGVLDVPELFLDPRRVQAALIWFGRGYVEYKFPNNAKVLNRTIAALELEMEMSSEVPGTNADWPSDISLWVNGHKVGTWTCPGDYGDRRGTYTPPWWKLEGSQYGILTTWRITSEGTFLGERRLGDVVLGDLDLDRHHSIRLRIGIDEREGRPGGVNIFGRGFGNYNQDIKMRLHLKGVKALPHVTS